MYKTLAPKKKPRRSIALPSSSKVPMARTTGPTLPIFRRFITHGQYLNALGENGRLTQENAALKKQIRDAMNESHEQKVDAMTVALESIDDDGILLQKLRKIRDDWDILKQGLQVASAEIIQLIEESDPHTNSPSLHEVAFIGPDPRFVLEELSPIEKPPIIVDPIREGKENLPTVGRIADCSIYKFDE